MSIAKVIEFDKENIKDLHFYLKGLQPLSGYLKDVDSNIWEFVRACIPDPNYDEDSTWVHNYKSEKVELYMDKIQIYFADIEGEQGPFWEDADEYPIYSEIDLDKGIAIYDLLTGELTDMFDRTFDREEIQEKFQRNLEEIKERPVQ